MLVGKFFFYVVDHITYKIGLEQSITISIFIKFTFTANHFEPVEQKVANVKDNAIRIY